LIFTLFEHRTIPFEWENKHLAALEQLNQSLEAEVLRATTERGQRVFKANHYVGVVRLGRDTIQILPKIDNGDSSAQSATRNLLYLLEQVGNFPTSKPELNSLLQQGQDWFELLTRLFVTELQQQWQRGPFCHYQVVEANLPTLKGRWRIVEQLRRPANDHRFEVTYDEFSPDNQLNRIFRFVTERLWGQSRDAENRRMLGELRQWMEEITLLPVVTAAQAPPALITRLNQRFLPILNLARLFLESETLIMAAGATQSFAFVFDMNRLFEAFIASLISHHPEQLLPPALQTAVLHFQAGNHALHLARKNGEQPVFKLRPDLVFAKDGVFPLLLDTKYKRLKSADVRSGISEADFYQMFAYVHRYHSPCALLLYPQVDEEVIRTHFSLIDHPATIAGATINLRRDLSKPVGRCELINELRDILTKMVGEIEEVTNGIII
jgi:5-methylcytosine-specific restriction enzyme subunit McrC